MKYSEHGAAVGGPAIVMIHGWGQSRRVFEPLARLLEDRFRVMAVDLAGFGESKNEPGPYTFDRYCGDLARFVSGRGFEKFHLLGWSMGGTIAARYVLENRGPAPESLILLSATPRFVAPAQNPGEGQSLTAVKRMERQIKTDPDLGLRAFISLFFESGERTDPALRGELEAALRQGNFPPNGEALAQTLGELRRADLTALDAPPSPSPVLLIHGALDKICPSGGQKLWRGLFDRTAFVSLEACGHAPHLTGTRDAATSVAGFISEL